MYRLGIDVLRDLLNAHNPTFALPSAPTVDPVIETGSGALGAWLLAAGVARMARMRRAAGPLLSVRHIAVLAPGLIVGALVTTSATLSVWYPEVRVAVLISAFGMLGWSGLALAVLDRGRPPAGRWLVFSGAILTLGAAGVNALDVLFAQRLSGLFGAHEAYLDVSVLGALAWLSLCIGFFALGGAETRVASGSAFGGRADARDWAGRRVLSGNAAAAGLRDDERAEDR